MPKQSFVLVPPLTNPCRRCHGSGSEWKKRKDGQPDRRYFFPIGPCLRCYGRQTEPAEARDV